MSSRRLHMVQIHKQTSTRAAPGLHTELCHPHHEPRGGKAARPCLAEAEMSDGQDDERSCKRLRTSHAVGARRKDDDDDDFSCSHYSNRRCCSVMHVASARSAAMGSNHVQHATDWMRFVLMAPRQAHEGKAISYWKVCCELSSSFSKCLFPV